ncbi:hypothetical protein ARHIZOSPH14_21510 [Agromyces rhizosphaerae]|uniref:Uncharacterized protein n=1 Tax=Agromyces rhizosphaerae TaxID=88374 RepID=A0A9W6CZ31_9MICO|nr:hypothetical protein [Agromyces rhizosphaerae]GLI27909.1 hypothetical protein ARHIZOSPH14_21510 [Agromyces rhizosphaerae]
MIVSVNADGAGFMPVIELADPDAADRLATLLEGAEASRTAPGAQGLDVTFGMRMSDGLRMRSDPQDGGAVFVVDDADEVHFTVAPPVMWDSSGPNPVLGREVTEVGQADRTRSPAEGDVIVPMATTISDDALVISPDEGMLSDPDTTWPVYIDPNYGPRTPSEWVAVRTGGYTGTLYKWSDISSTMQGQGVGLCSHVASCNTVFTQRLAWEFGGMATIRNLDEDDIVSASFRVNGVHAASCEVIRPGFRSYRFPCPAVAGRPDSWSA